MTQSATVANKMDECPVNNYYENVLGNLTICWANEIPTDCKLEKS